METRGWVLGFGFCGLGGGVEGVGLGIEVGVQGLGFRVQGRVRLTAGEKPL